MDRSVTWVPLSTVAVAKGLIGGPFGSSLGRKDYQPDGIPVIRGHNLSGDRPFCTDDFVYVSLEKAQGLLHRNLAQPDDVIFTQRGTLGQVGLVPSEPYETYVISQSQMRLRTDPTKADARYVYFCFRDPTMVDAIQRRATATGVPHINLATLADIEIPLRPLPQQCAIAEVLGALDDKIEANRSVASKAEALAIRLPALVEQSTSVGEVANSAHKTVATSYFAGKEVEHFSLPAFDASRLPLVESGDGIKSGKCLLERPTVLVSKLNPHIPRVWMAIPSGTCPAVTSTEFVGLTPATDYATEVLWALCSSDGFNSQLLEMVKGTTGSHQRVCREDILALQIPDPEAMARDVCEAIAALVRLAGGLRRESARLASLRDTLLPRLLSGELRLRDAGQLAEEAL